MKYHSTGTRRNDLHSMTNCLKYLPHLFGWKSNVIWGCVCKRHKKNIFKFSYLYLLNQIFRGNNFVISKLYTIYWPLELHARVYCEGLAAGVGGAEARNEPAPVEDLLPHAELLPAGRLPVALQLQHHGGVRHVQQAPLDSSLDPAAQQHRLSSKVQ